MKKKKRDFSKTITLTVAILGALIAQECLVLIGLAIWKDFTSTAAYLTAAVGLAEAVIGASLNFYIGMAKSDHKEGGITFEAAKAKNFEEEKDDNFQSPAV